MAPGNHADFDRLTPEQRKQLVAGFSPMLDQFATEWRAQFEPLVSQLRESLVIRNPALEQVIQQIRDMFVRIEIPVLVLPTFEVPKIDLAVLLTNFPSNLHTRIDDLGGLVDIALNDGIPIAWIPRDEILANLLDETSVTDRHALLVQHRDEILDDCDTALDDRVSIWSDAAREAIDSARRGSHGVAQSHAANLIDSVLLTEFADPNHKRNTRQPRADAESLARRAVSLEDTLNQLGRHLAVMPVPSAFARWYPGDPPPVAFNRHATAHHVGHPDVFSQSFCLIAVMLATSLVRQFGP